MSKYARGGGRGQTRLGLPHTQRMVSLGRGMSLKDKGQPSSKDAAAGAAGKASVAAGSSAEESFQLFSDGTVAPFAIMIRLTPGMWEEFRRTEAEGSSSAMRFGLNSSGHAIKVGSEEFRFSSAPEPGELYDIYEEQQRGESGAGVLVEKGPVWRKVAVQRTLSASEKDRLKKRSVEAERQQKSRKAIVLEHSNSLMKNQVAAANDGGSGRKFMHAKAHSNGMQPLANKSKSTTSGFAAAKPKPGSFSSASQSVGNVKPKLSAPVSPEVITAAARPSASALAATMLPPKGRPAVEEASAAGKLKAFSPVSAGQGEGSGKSGAAVNMTDLRNLLITLLTESDKGLTMKNLERAIGEAMPNFQAGLKKTIEKALKGIATFHAPGKYRLKEGIEKGSFVKPSGNSPDSAPMDSPPLADSPALPDASSDATQDVALVDIQAGKEATEVGGTGRAQLSVDGESASPKAGHNPDKPQKEQFQRPPIRKKDAQPKREDLHTTASAAPHDMKRTTPQANGSDRMRHEKVAASEANGFETSVEATPSDTQEVILKMHLAENQTSDKSDGSDSSSSGGSASDSGSDSESGSDSGSGSDSDSDSSSSSGDEESADEEVHIVSDEENEEGADGDVAMKSKLKSKEPFPGLNEKLSSPPPLWNASQGKEDNEDASGRAAVPVEDEDVDISGPVEDEEVDVVSSEGGPASPQQGKPANSYPMGVHTIGSDVQKPQHGSNLMLDGAPVSSPRLSVHEATPEVRKEKNASESDNSIEALETRAENGGARLAESVGKDGKTSIKHGREGPGLSSNNSIITGGEGPSKSKGPAGKTQPGNTDKASERAWQNGPAEVGGTLDAQKASSHKGQAGSDALGAESKPQKPSVKVASVAKKSFKNAPKSRQAVIQAKSNKVYGELRRAGTGGEVKSANAAQVGTKNRDQVGIAGLDVDARVLERQGQSMSASNQDSEHFGRQGKEPDLCWKNNKEPGVLGKFGMGTEMFSRNGRDQYEGHGSDSTSHPWPNRDVRQQNRQPDLSRRNDMEDDSVPDGEPTGKLESLGKRVQDGKSRAKPAMVEHMEDAEMLSDGEIKEGLEEQAKAWSDKEPGELDDMMVQSFDHVEKEANELSGTKAAESLEAPKRNAGRPLKKDPLAKKTQAGRRDGQRSEPAPLRLEPPATGKSEPAVSKSAEVLKGGKADGRGTKRQVDDIGQSEAKKSMKKSVIAPGNRLNTGTVTKRVKVGGGEWAQKSASAVKQKKPSPELKQVKPSPDPREVNPSPELKQIRPSPESTSNIGGAEGAKSSPSEGAQDLHVMGNKVPLEKKIQKPTLKMKESLPGSQNNRKAALDSKTYSGSVKEGSKRKQAVVEISNAGTARKKTTLSHVSQEDMWFLPYEKNQPELRGPIGNFEEYTRFCREYDEKHPIYTRLNSCLEADKDNFERFRRNIDLAKAEEDKQKLASIYGDLTDTYVMNWERFRRMRDTFLSLHHELQSIKRRCKEYAEKLGDG